MYDIIDNNSFFLLINKHPGCSFHNEKSGEGLFSRLKADFASDTLFPVHRLDRITSGLLIAAKDKKTATVLSGMFAEGQVSKYYLALSEKRPRKMKGIVEGDMKKGRRGSWRLTRSVENPAKTCYTARSIGEGRCLFLIRPKTGKTHQIRAALKSLGAPVSGDPLYASSSGADRAYLHAYALKFTLGQVTYEYVCPPAQGSYFQEECFVNALEKLKHPWEII